MRSSRDNAGATDPLLLALASSLRRMAISLTAKALWQLVGFRGQDGATETRNVEPFTGIGFYSRPSLNGKPEAIVVMVGAGGGIVDAAVSPGTPAIVATRDEQTRAAVAGDLQPDETAIFNSLAILLVKADGTFEARSVAGIAKQLAFNDQLTALKAAIAGAAVVAGDGGAALKANILAALGGAWPVGTTKLKGE